MQNQEIKNIIILLKLVQFGRILPLKIITH